MAPEQEGNLIGRGVRQPEWGSPLPRKPRTRGHLASFKSRQCLGNPWRP